MDAEQESSRQSSHNQDVALPIISAPFTPTPSDRAKQKKRTKGVKVPAEGTSPRASWSDDQKLYLLSLLYELKTQGKMADTNFKKEAWVSARTQFNKHFNCEYTPTHFTTQWATLKTEYKAYKALSISGFGWDEDSCKPTASPEVWNTLCQSNPAARRFRDRPYCYRDLSAQLFDGIVATGEYAVSSATLATSDEANESQQTVAQANSDAGEEFPGMFPVDQGSSRSGRSLSPRKRIRQTSAAAASAVELASSITNGMATLGAMKEETKTKRALTKFIVWATTGRTMTTRTKATCKQIIGMSNPDVFLALEDDEYKDWFEIMFERENYGAFIVVELKSSRLPTPESELPLQDGLLQEPLQIDLNSQIRSLRELERESPEVELP